jgi:NAD(P)H-hydrate epimerase
MLSSLAALRGGAGIVKLLHPAGMEAELSTSPYELIRVPYNYKDVDAIVELMNKACATFIGPGMGQSPEAKKLLLAVLPRLEKPCVIDADALNIIAQEKATIPKNAIITPHHGEMMRLLHTTEKLKLDIPSLEICRTYAEEHEVTLVLKGGPTFIFHPNNPYIVNPTGDPGMATAGSGDVLTGLLAALLAQGLPPKDAAALGVFLHGIAGEVACEDTSSYCMIASDIIFRFPEAFKILKANVPTL